MLSPTREQRTSAATFWATTAACTALLFPIAAKVLPNPFLALAASFAGGETVVIMQGNRATAKNRRYKQRPLPPSNSIGAQPPPPTVAEKSLPPTDIVWPENGNIKKTKRFLIVPEGYDAETLASGPFRAALQRYQQFLQQHLPAELITVGIAYPEQSIPSVTPDAQWGHRRPRQHPLQAETDALLIVLNGEQHRLIPHANFYYQTAVSWGPSATGGADLEMLATVLHESLHLCSTGSGHTMDDSYEHDLSPCSADIDSFNHSGFLPYVPRENWPDTLVTRAIKAFDVPLFRYTQDGKDYWAVSNRANVMDNASFIESNPVNLAAFLLTGGQYLDPYQRYLVCHGSVEELLEEYKRITPEEAAVLREKFSLDNIKASAVSPLYYLTQSIKDR